MSRVARIPVTVAKGVDVQVTDSNITVKGPLGTLKQALSAASRSNWPTARCRSLLPTSRARPAP